MCQMWFTMMDDDNVSSIYFQNSVFKKKENKAERFTEMVMV